jgi:hypothetical protein
MNQLSAVAECSAATKHSIDFDGTEVTVNICTYHPRIIRDTIEIPNHPTTSTMKMDTD